MTTPPIITNAPEARYIPASMEDVLDEDQCRSWLQLGREEFAKKVRGNQIPSMPFGQRTKRFHVRTVLKKLKQATE